MKSSSKNNSNYLNSSNNSNYTNQDCTNYNQYMMNSNYDLDSNDEDLDELSRLGTEYSHELAFNSQVKKNQQRAFNDLENRREKYTNKKHTGSKINKQK